MGIWLFRTAAQRLESFIPGHDHVHNFFQAYVTKSLFLNPVTFQERLRGEFLQHLETCFAGQRSGTAAPNVLELGTGWYPIAPIAFYLCGAARVWTLDLKPLLRPAAVRRTLQLFISASERGDLKKIVPMIHEDRISNLRTASEMGESASASAILGQLNINVVVGKACRTGLSKSSIHFFFSNTVLQYICETDLLAIFVEFNRLGAPGAIMTHNIYMGDQNSRNDPSITPFNFLKFSDATWHLLDSPLRLQNRLRISDYRRIHERAGWIIESEKHTQGSLNDFRRVRVAREFLHCSHEDLLTLRSFVVSRASGHAVQL